MKLVIRTVFFHFMCILIFSLVYWVYRDDFKRDDKNPGDFIDYLFLSTTVQAGVGYSDLYPISHTSKLIMIFQQFIMISTNVFLLYLFTL
jgi:hypothetical protein